MERLKVRMSMAQAMLKKPKSCAMFCSTRTNCTQNAQTRKRTHIVGSAHSKNRSPARRPAGTTISPPAPSSKYKDGAPSNTIPPNPKMQAC